MTEATGSKRTLGPWLQSKSGRLQSSAPVIHQALAFLKPSYTLACQGFLLIYANMTEWKECWPDWTEEGPTLSATLLQDWHTHDPSAILGCCTSGPEENYSHLVDLIICKYVTEIMSMYPFGT